MAGVEDFDTDEEVYRRRMGLRRYFKELRMNMQRIERAKDQKAAGRNEEKKKTKKAKKDGEGAGEGGASPGEKEKKSKTSTKVSAGGTTPAKKASGGSALAGKKKVSKK